ncbi:uncharacterized protein IAS62_004916 [Cryptococcus decagattii]|uniref:Uncharacterized protein n=1 Tax=Cryptococcus decagattii TaxID=1859122 RepID=A0ABZ2AYD8_9TREE
MPCFLIFKSKNFLFRGLGGPELLVADNFSLPIFCINSAFYVPIVWDDHLILTSVHPQLAQRPGLNSLFLLFIPGAKILKVPESQFDKAWKAILMFPIRQQLQCWIFMFAYRALKNLLVSSCIFHFLKSEQFKFKMKMRIRQFRRDRKGTTIP